MFRNVKCPNCGAKNPKESVACTECGATFALSHVEQQARGRERPTPGAEPEEPAEGVVCTNCGTQNSSLRSICLSFGTWIGRPLHANTTSVWERVGITASRSEAPDTWMPWWWPDLRTCFQTMGVDIDTDMDPFKARYVPFRNTNLDGVKIEAFSASAMGGAGGLGAVGYRLQYVVTSEIDFVVLGARLRTPDNPKLAPDRYDARTQRKMRGILHRTMGDFQWVGGQLADSLNEDTSLRKLVFSALEESRSDAEVIWDQETPGYRIDFFGWCFKWRAIWPSRNQLQAADGIACHIRSMLRKPRYEYLYDYTRAIEVNPNDATGYVNRAAAYKENEQYYEAIDDFTKAIQINFKLAEAYLGRGKAYAAQGKQAEAISDFEKCIAISRDAGLYAEAYLNRGKAYAAQGKKAEAICDLEKCIALSDDHALIGPANEVLATLR